MNLKKKKLYKTFVKFVQNIVISSIFNISKNVKSFSTSCKLLNETPPSTTTTTTTNPVLFHIEEKLDLGYAIFRLNLAPVNSLNLEFLTAINIQLEKFEQTKNINGIILTSNLPNIFSAGLNIMEMYNPKEDRLRQFWSALQGIK